MTFVGGEMTMGRNDRIPCYAQAAFVRDVTARETPFSPKYV